MPTSSNDAKLRQLRLALHVHLFNNEDHAQCHG